MNYDEGNEGQFGGHGGYGRRNNRFSEGASTPKPVKVGDELDLKVEAVASKGDGIAKKDGFVIFVKGAKEGDEVKVKITDVKERFATAELMS